jgi:SEC-C motif-containing protein
MTQTDTCPCGSGAALAQCCLPMIQGKKKAPTAEALLRSRYTAFTRGDIDYILATHHTKTRGEIKREEIEEWSKNSKWLGLEIQQKAGGEASDDQGQIVFLARYEADGKVNDHWEHSLFQKENGEWRFVDAQGVQQGPIRRTAPKIGRNDPCTCGSGKKYKKCCGAAA